MKEWIALNMTPGVGPRAAARLLERFGSAEGVFGALRSELEALGLPVTQLNGEQVPAKRGGTWHPTTVARVLRRTS